MLPDGLAMGDLICHINEIHPAAEGLSKTLHYLSLMLSFA